MCTSVSRVSFATRTTCSVTSFTTETRVQITAGHVMTRLGTTRATRMATNSVWMAGRGNTAPIVSQTHTLTTEQAVAILPPSMTYFYCLLIKQVASNFELP